MALAAPVSNSDVGRLLSQPYVIALVAVAIVLLTYTGGSSGGGGGGGY